MTNLHVCDNNLPKRNETSCTSRTLVTSLKQIYALKTGLDLLRLSESTAPPLKHLIKKEGYTVSSHPWA